MKLNTGIWVSKPDRSETAYVIMNGKILKPIDAIIGCVTVLGGIGYMLFKAYKNGGAAFDKGEFEALSKIGCV